MSLLNNLEPWTLFGVGSLPYVDPAAALDHVFRHYPAIPFWPQLPQRDWKEDMRYQFLERFPGLVYVTERGRNEMRVDVNLFKREVVAARKMLLQSLQRGELSFFDLSAEVAAGYSLFRDQVSQGAFEIYPKWIKLQVVGPMTLGQTLFSTEGKKLRDYADIQTFLMQWVIVKGLVQVAFVRKLGLPALLVIDEPILPPEGISFLKMAQEICQKREVAIGVHCCGSSSWGEILSLGLDLIHFDVTLYLNDFLLAMETVSTLNTAISWGIISPQISDFAEGMVDEFLKKIRALPQREKILSTSLLSFSCGLGSVALEKEKGLMEVLKNTQKQLREWVSI